jgi:23S rRNA pseudouridine2605 synthase
MATPVSVELHDVAEKNTWLRIVVVEGRQHLIKRMCAAIGHPVVRLFRPAHAGISVKGMQPGQLRRLSPEEVERLLAFSRGEGNATSGALFLPVRQHREEPPRKDAAQKRNSPRARYKS